MATGIVQARYYSSDALATTLTAALGPTGNPSVASIAGLPSSYPYTMLIDWGLSNQEAISVTSAPTGTGPWALPCIRGIDGSTGGSGGTSHAGPSPGPAAVIVHGVTAQDFQQPLAYADGISGFPWEFNVLAYGASGNGQFVTDGAMSSSSSTTTLTCATSTPFTASMVGWPVIVNGAGPDTTTALAGTIATFVSSSQVTVSVACQTTVTGAYVFFGADDTTAFSNCIAAATTYMNANGFAKVIKPPPPNGLFYAIGGPLITAGSANSQIPLPNPSATNPQGTLHLWGPEAPVLPLWTMTVPQFNGGLVSNGMWASTGAQSTNNATFGDSAVIGSTPAYASLLPNVGGLPAFANINVIIENWTVTTPAASHGINYAGISLRGCAKGEFRHCAALITTDYNCSAAPNAFPTVSQLISGLSVSLLVPGNGNNATAMYRDCSTSGYSFGMTLVEETVVDRCVIVGHGYAFKYYGADPVSNAHGAVITGGTTAQKCYQVFLMSGAGAGSGCHLDGELDVEVIANSGAGALLSGLSGSGADLATLYGQLRLTGNYHLSIFPPLWPTPMRMISAGGQTAPGWVFSYGGFTTAGTTVAVQNPYWQDAVVVFSGGTITGVSAGATLGGSAGSATTAPAMTATGLSGSGSVPWPAGGWLSFAFTGSPTWDVCVG